MPLFFLFIVALPMRYFNLAFFFINPDHSIVTQFIVDTALI